MTSLSISEFKAIAATLGRFADIRDTAKEPRDRIIVQVAAGRLKFIAGDDNMTVVADVGAAQGKDRAVVKARLLLNAAKSLRGRGEVEVEVDRGGCFLRASGGGQVSLSAIASVLPAFVRPPKKAEATTVVQHPGFETASKVFPAVTSKHHPADKVYITSGDGRLTLTGCDQRSFGRWSMPVGYEGEPWNVGAVPATLFPALRDLDEPGVMAWSMDDRLAIRSGRFLVGVRLDKTPLPWPVPAHSPVIRVVVDRKPLIDALKGSMDGMHRSRIRVENQTLHVDAWDSSGSVELGAYQTEGRGRVGVAADRMQKLLTALPGRQAVIEFEGVTAGPIGLSTEEATGWQTLLAPVL